MSFFCRLTLVLILLFSLLFCPVFAQEKFSFVVLGDSFGGEEIYNKLLDKIGQDKSIDFVVHLGDFVGQGKKAEYEKYINFISAKGLKIYHVPGNHDLYKGGGINFQDFIGPFYYAFEHKGAKFIFLNNAFDKSFTVRQFDWLKEELRNNREKAIFVFLHRPLFDPQGFYSEHFLQPEAIRQELLALFDKYNVKYVFSGHFHGFLRAQRKNTNYIVSGGAGSYLLMPEFLGGYYHYIKLTVQEKTIADEIIKID